MSLLRGREAWARGGAGEPEKRGPPGRRKSQERQPRAGHDCAGHGPLCRPRSPVQATCSGAGAEGRRTPTCKWLTKEPQQKSQGGCGGGGWEVEGGTRTEQGQDFRAEMGSEV